MMVQAWNIYSFAYPIVHQFFGIQPDAAKKEITIAPQMPDAWDEAALEQVKVGENTISVFYKMENGEPKIKVTQTHPEWTLKLVVHNEEIVTGKGEGIGN